MYLKKYFKNVFKNMHCRFLGWILEQKNDNTGKMGDIQMRSVVYLAAFCQHEFLSFDKCSWVTCSLCGELDEGHVGALNYLCNFTVHLNYSETKCVLKKKEG